MPVTRDMLLAELQNLLRLTAFEQTIATVRRAQARTPQLQQELAQNARKAGERRALLADAIRRAGGVPDVVGSALGKVGALATAQLNQVQTLQGALLGDLSLEHQLRERTRYARTLAESLHESSVLPVLDRLEEAHSATIDWLEQRLTEVGTTGTSMLRPTPVQAVVGSARRVVGAPLAAAAAGVNTVTGLVGRFTRRVPGAAADAASQAAGAASQAAGAAAGAASQVRDAASQAAGAAAGAASQAAEQVRDAASQAAGSAETATPDLADARRRATGVAQDAGDAARAVTGGAAQAGAQVIDLTSAAGSSAAGTSAAGSSATGASARSASGPEAKAPFAGYEKLSGDSVMRHVRDTEDVEELQALLAFEQANKARKGVLAAVSERLTELGVRA